MRQWILHSLVERMINGKVSDEYRQGFLQCFSEIEYLNPVKPVVKEEDDNVSMQGLE